jgi:sugar lactone lactonase YvrE
MYLSDSRHSVIWAYNYEPETGEVSDRRVFYKTTAEQGRPDGAAVDEFGFYWFASFGGSRIIRLTPNGDVDRETPFPIQFPTMLSFGGTKMDTLFVTSHNGDGISTSSRPGIFLQYRSPDAGLKR